MNLSHSFISTFIFFFFFYGLYRVVKRYIIVYTIIHIDTEYLIKIRYLICVLSYTVIYRIIHDLKLFSKLNLETGINR